jgi:DNA-binding MarR family transcriptional regulator
MDRPPSQPSPASSPGDAQPARLETLPTWLLSRAAARSHQLLTDALQVAGARGYHYRLLAALEEFGPASQAELGRRTDIDRSDVVASLNELERDALVRRQPDPSDGRRNVVTITAAGERRLQKLDRVLAGVQEELLAPFSDDERGDFVRLLRQLAER